MWGGQCWLMVVKGEMEKSPIAAYLSLKGIQNEMARDG